ncbi:MAG: ATP-binding cassette domain-containing protein, partial [Pseudomonadota bacterium]|nr:ATP-binding cassette domain-containing protein [Pseudomonadota bacterium]
ENVILGVEPTTGADYLDLDAARAQVQAINTDYGMQVPTDALIETLPVGIQQRVEILKVLFRSADVLILDEPTAVLTPQEVEEFFTIVRSLRDAGKAIVFITHKLHEILEIADRVSVLRQGRVVGTGQPDSFSEADLAEMMVGRPVSFSVERSAARTGDAVLRLNDVTLVDRTLESSLTAIDLTVREGEVVGIAGVQGNGQTELVEVITGLATASSGSIEFSGADITRASVRARHSLGIAHIPEDRHKSGMVGAFTVAENIVLNSYYDSSVTNGVQID